jgi:hypothetical protein
VCAGAEDEKGKGKPRSLLEANKVDKTQEADAAQHGGWGGYGGGHGSGHWDYGEWCAACVQQVSVFLVG